MNKHLYDMLDSNDETDRVYAAQDALEVIDSDLFGKLVSNLNDEKQQIVKEAIVETLIQSAKRESIWTNVNLEAVYRLFSSKDPFVRNSSIDIFSNGEELVVIFLQNKYQNANVDLQKYILDTYNEIPTDAATDNIRKSLLSSDFNVLITAVEYLGKRKDTTVLPQMVKMFGESNEPMLKIAIIEAVVQMNDIATMKEILELLNIKSLQEDEMLVYFPLILKLSAPVVELETGLLFLEKYATDHIIYNYAVEIVNFVTDLSKRFDSVLLNYSQIKKLLIEFLKYENQDMILFYSIVRLMEQSSNPLIASKLDSMKWNDPLDITNLKNELEKILALN